MQSYAAQPVTRLRRGSSVRSGRTTEHIESVGEVQLWWQYGVSGSVPVATDYSATERMMWICSIFLFNYAPPVPIQDCLHLFWCHMADGDAEELSVVECAQSPLGRPVAWHLLLRPRSTATDHRQGVLHPLPHPRWCPVCEAM